MITKRLKINGYKSHITFEYAHCLPDHVHCSHLHGHSGALSLRVKGEPSGPYGFLIDFSLAKRTLRAIAKNFDHRFIAPEASNGRHGKRNHYSVIQIGNKRRVLPTSDVVTVPVRRTTAEEMSELVLKRFVLRLRRAGAISNLTSISVGWHEGPSATVWSEWKRDP